MSRGSAPDRVRAARSVQHFLACSTTGRSMAWVFVAVGGSLGLRVAALNGAANITDQALLCGWFALVFGLPLAILARFIEMLGEYMARHWAPIRTLVAISLVAAAALLASKALTSGLLGDTPVLPRLTSATVAAAIAAASLSASPVRAGVALIGCAVLGGLAATTHVPGSAAMEILDPVRRPVPTSHRRVLLIGIDGLDPDTVQRMVAGGRLPHFGRLLSRGSYGDLITLKNSYSPVIWTTVATGKLPTRHGVKGTFRLPGVATPVAEYPLGIGCTRLLRHLAALDVWRSVPLSGAMRRVEALWNIASHSGLTVAVVGWWPSWPAEAVNGFMVTDRFWLLSRNRHTPPANTYFPSSARSRLEAQLVSATSISPDLVARLLPRRGIRPDDSLRNTLLEQIAADLSHLGIANEVQRNMDLTMVYLRSVDVFSHLVGRYSQVTSDDGRADRSDSYATTLDTLYELLDDWVGSLVRQAGEDAAVILCSDHGFTWEGSTYGHTSYPPGFLAVAGPDVRPGHMASQHVTDIAPTTLRLLGLPTAADMDGHPIERVLSTNGVPSSTMIPSYETGLRLVSAPESAVDDEIREGLRALGYVQ